MVVHIVGRLYMLRMQPISLFESEHSLLLVFLRLLCIWIAILFLTATTAVEDYDLDNLDIRCVSLIFRRCRSFSTHNQDDIFGEQNRARCIEKLKSYRPVTLTEKDLEKRQKAAVLVPLCHVGGEPSILYTLRNAHLKRDGGHVSFPGGLQDDKDATLEDTALRETLEELGINKDVVNVWGHGSYLTTREMKVIVLPYVGYVGEIDIQKLTFSAAEVAQVFSVPIKALCDPENFAYTQFRTRYILPVYLNTEHRVWGLTALITHMVLISLLPNIYKNKLKLIKPVATS